MDSLPESSTETLPCCASAEHCALFDEVLRLRKEVEELRHQVQTDALTNLYNFRFFSNVLPLEMERTRRSSQSLALIILDIDYFKQFNDRWGHELGNQALIHVSRLMMDAIRKLDFACRFGGEEFAIVLPATDLTQALSVAERLRETIETNPMEVGANPIFLTASLGVDVFTPGDTESPQAFIERVDAWLYLAKNEGRNRVKGPVPTPLVNTRSQVTADEKNALFEALQEVDK